jgi:hypothetical protein
MASVPRFIYLLQKIEAAYPQWTTDQLVTNLRHTGPYDGSFFQTLLGTKPGVRILPAGNLTEAEINEVDDAMRHDTLGGNEVGISLDASTGRYVAIGHVIAGISGGIHHPEPLNPPPLSVEIKGVKIPLVLSIQAWSGVPMFYQVPGGRYGIDPLYAITIAGDLGQTVTPPFTRSRTEPFGGVGSEATAAELIGDIDGFMMGYWLASTTSGQDARKAMVKGNSVKVSTMLAEYYRTRTDKPLFMTDGRGGATALEAISRFSSFNITFETLRDTFVKQTVLFNSYYAPIVKLTSSNEIASAEVVWEFEQWCRNGGKWK